MSEVNSNFAWNQIRANWPIIITIVAGGLWVNNGIEKTKDKTVDLEKSVEKLLSSFESVTHMGYRMDEAERSIKQTNTRLDNLSNTMINNVDLIRRDVNRQTTQIEVLASKLDIFMGVDSEAPKQRRSRPGGPIPVDQSE